MEAAGKDYRFMRRTPNPSAEGFHAEMTRNKYNAVKTVVDGITFDSKAEARRYSELKLLEAAGEITHLELQPRFPIFIDGQDVKFPNGRTLTYVADFRYYDKTGRVVEDCKGFKTPVYKIKKALVEHIYKTKITEVK